MDVTEPLYPVTVVSDLRRRAPSTAIRSTSGQPGDSEQDRGAGFFLAAFGGRDVDL
jgi:hypothetical protein